MWAEKSSDGSMYVGSRILLASIAHLLDAGNSMNLALFSEMSVRDFYDSTVTQQVERRIFDLTEDEALGIQPSSRIDRLLSVNGPGRLVLDPAVNEEVRTRDEDRLMIRRWLEYSGSARLLSLRPRQYHATPPFVSLLQSPSAGQAGRILLEQSVRTAPEKKLFDDFCETEFRKITEYVGWINDDLDYYERIAREWLLSILESRINRLESRGLEREETGATGPSGETLSFP